jgi:hypothetical protein
MGADFAQAALTAGLAVVVSGRDSNRVSKAFGQSNDPLAVKLDFTSRADAECGRAVRCQPVSAATRAGHLGAPLRVIDGFSTVGIEAEKQRCSICRKQHHSKAHLIFVTKSKQSARL